MANRTIRWSIAARLFAVQVVFVIAVAVIAAGWAWRSSAADVEREAASQCMALAVSIADNPFVLAAVQSADPTAELQPYAVDLMEDTTTDFVTIMAPDRTRYTHPDPAQIGLDFQGTIAPALDGERFTETYTGTLGPSIRAVVPIEDAGGSVVAIVAAGVTVANIAGVLSGRLWLIFGAALITIAIGAALSWLFSRYLRRVTGGQGPEQMGRMLEYYEGVLHSVREGLVLVDARGRLTMFNDHAAELLHLPVNRTGSPVPIEDLPLPQSLAELLASGRAASDEIHVTDERMLVVNQQVTSPKRIGRAGTVTTFRDHTELMSLADEVQTMRTLSDALRSQTHEFANRLHTIVALIELGRAPEALGFAARELELEQEMADHLVEAIQEPVLAALLLGKAAQARERSVTLELAIESGLGGLEIDARDVVTILGNLIDNALDAVSAGTGGSGAAGGTVIVGIHRAADGAVQFRVADNGPGVPDIDKAFGRGFSTKEAGREGRGFGLALVRQAVQRAGGHITVRSDAQGTTFEVVLPAEPRPVAATPGREGAALPRLRSSS